jgi:hypothetical protein
MSDLDDVNFPVTVANCISPIGCHLNSIGVIQQQNDSSKVHCDYPKASRTKSRPTALRFINKNTATSLDRHCEYVQKRKPMTTRYQVMLKSLITDTVTDVVECVRTLLAFVRNQHFTALQGESLK